MAEHFIRCESAAIEVKADVKRRPQLGRKTRNDHVGVMFSVQLKSHGHDGDPRAREKLLLKDFAVLCRLCALTNKPLPIFQV